MNAFLVYDNTRLSFYTNCQNKNVGFWYILLYTHNAMKFQLVSIYVWMETWKVGNKIVWLNNGMLKRFC
jgi:hypothetical protein